MHATISLFHLISVTLAVGAPSPPSTLICQTVELNKPMLHALRLDTNMSMVSIQVWYKIKYEDSEVEDLEEAELEEIVVEISVNSITLKVSNANRVLNIYTVRYLFPSYNKRSLFVEVTSCHYLHSTKWNFFNQSPSPLDYTLLHLIDLL